MDNNFAGIAQTRYHETECALGWEKLPEEMQARYIREVQEWVTLIESCGFTIVPTVQFREMGQAMVKMYRERLS